MAFSINIPDEPIKEKKCLPSAPIQTPIPEPEVDTNKNTNYGCAMKMTKWLVVLCLSCLLLSALASPVLKSESRSGEGRQASGDVGIVADNSVASGVSAAPAASAALPAAAPAPSPDKEEDEDDEDDDDDVDLELGDDDDDDDDDDDEESPGSPADDDDDDDDDYDFERFFDDLLGDDDDDEDDEEDEPAPAGASAAPVSVTPAPASTSPALTGLAASNVDYNAADYANAPGEAPLNNDAAYDEEDQDLPSPNTVTLLSNSNQNAIDDQADIAENAVSPSPSSTGDDDEDEDDDDIGLSVEDDDDDDDDDDDEETEEDDGEDEGNEDSDGATAKEGRKLGGHVNEREGRAGSDIVMTKQARGLGARALSQNGETIAPAYIAKYNRFIDTILMRVNKILKKSYDPVNVRLQSPTDTKKKGAKPTTTKKNKTKTKLKTKRRPVNKETRTDELQLNQTSSNVQSTNKSAPANQVMEAAEIQPKIRQNLVTSTDLPPTHREARKRKVVKTKTKVQLSRNNPRAKATLYGLSSMRRDGDVTANVMRSHTTVRARFLVGPLTLKVEKEFGRGVKKELRSATATTAELVGKLNLRVVQGGSATLHSIRVLQPKQVRIDTGAPDDNDQDQTREFMWKRSSNIAHLVSEKLSSVTRAMLQPPQAHHDSTSSTQPPKQV